MIAMEKTMKREDIDYEQWFIIAATAGIDWENDLPPKEMLTEELCVAAIQGAPPENFAKMPVELRTAAVCFAAVYTDYNALQYVPEHLQEEIKARIKKELP